MTQRVFDIDNMQDVKDLFNILPDYVIRLRREDVTDNVEMFDDKNEWRGTLHSIKINWRDKTEIKRPVDYSKYIGKLGWFWNSQDTDEADIGILISLRDNHYKYVRRNSTLNYNSFRPLTLEETKNLIAEDIK